MVLFAEEDAVGLYLNQGNITLVHAKLNKNIVQIFVKVI